MCFRCDLEALYEEDPAHAAKIEHRLRRKQEMLNSSIQKTQSEQKQQFDGYLQTEKTTATANSGGVINIEGNTFSFDSSAKSGGVVKANEFLSNQTKATVSSGGLCKAYGRDVFEAKASLGGAIDVYGSPKSLNQTISLGGSIKEIKKND